MYMKDSDIADRLKGLAERVTLLTELVHLDPWVVGSIAADLLELADDVVDGG